MKKGINSLLILVVVCIWSYIIYIFFFYKKNVVYTEREYNNPSSELLIQKDTFSFKTLKRNPFLYKTILVNRKHIKMKTIDRSIQKVTFTSWPRIEYVGYLEKGEQHQKIVLLRVNNKLEKHRKSSLINNEIKIQYIDHDSIQLFFKGNTKTILKF